MLLNQAKSKILKQCFHFTLKPNEGISDINDYNNDKYASASSSANVSKKRKVNSSVSPVSSRNLR